MSTKFPFSKARLQALEAPTKSRVYLYDSKTPSLALCVTPAGSKTFYVYRKIQGRPERIRLGTFGELTVEAARTAARALVGHIARGGDPVGERERARAVATLKGLFERWGELHASIHRRTWGDRRGLQPDAGPKADPCDRPYQNGPGFLRPYRPTASDG